MALTIDELNIQIEAESNKATSAIDTLIGRLEGLQGKLNVLGTAGKSAGKGLQETAKGAEKADKATEKHKNSTDKATKSIQKFTDKIAKQISKYRTLMGAFKSAANVMASWYNESNDYIETMNLFNITMGSGAETATEYAQKVQQLMGIDIGEWSKNQGTFKALTAGFGVATDDANKMSQQLTQLTYDLSSFFNTDTEVAFDKLSSAMAGQVKGLREFGIDTTVASLQQYALSRGINQSVSSMTQAQKALLRYNLILEKAQKIGATGDMARTLTTPANALRILNSQLTIMKRELGNIVSVLVTQFIPWVQAGVQIVTEWARALAKIFGFDASVFDFSNKKSDISDSFGAAEESAENIQESVKKIKKQLMGFDELNILGSPDSSESDSATGGSGWEDSLGVGEYNFLENLKTPDLEPYKKALKEILSLAATVGGTIAAWKISKAVLDFFINPGNLGLFKMMGELFGVSDVLNALTLGDKFSTLGGSILAVAGAAAIVYGVFDAWINGLDWKNFAFLLGGVAVAATGVYLAIKPFSTTLAPIIAGVVAVVGGIALLLVGVKDFINNGPTLQNTILIIGGAIAIAVGLATAGLSVLVSAIIAAVAAVGAFVAAIILEKPAIMSVEDAQNALTDAKNKAAEAENSYISAIDNAEASLKALEEAEKKTGLSGAELYNQVQNGTLDYKNMTDAQKEVYKAYLDNEQKQKDLDVATKELTKATRDATLASLDNEIALGKEAGSYDVAKKSIMDAFNQGKISASEARDKLALAMSEMSNDSQKTFMEDLPNDIKEGLNPHKYESTGTKIKKWFGNLWKDIQGVFSDIGSFFSNVGKKIGDAVSGAFKSAVNWIMERIVNKINGFFKAINWGIGVINKIPGVEITPLAMLDVPKLAGGGIVDAGQMFIAREAGPELVGSIGRKTAVANNDQIISGIESGVYRAMMAANSNNSGGNQTIHIISEIDGDVVGEKVIKYHNGKVMQTGASPLLV
jgi:predicted translin family RNA/ssDNA-binding protein